MKRAYKIIRTILVTLLLLAITVPTTIYVLLSLPSVQRRLCEITERELSSLFQTPVDIRTIALTPFNRVTLLGVTMLDARGDTCLTIERLGTAVSYRALLRHKLVFDYAELIGMNAVVTRDSVGTPLNIQPIIDALKPKPQAGRRRKFEFAINTVVIRTSRVSYDILSLPPAEQGRFDRNHIALTDLRADVSLPKIASDDFIVDLRRLAANERSGFAVKRLACLLKAEGSRLSILDPVIELPHSLLTFNNQRLNLDSLRGDWRNYPINLQLPQSTHISAADVVPFVPALKNLGMTLNIEAEVSGTPADMTVGRLKAADQTGAMKLNISEAHLRDIDRREALALDIPELALECNGTTIADIVGGFTDLPSFPAKLLANVGQTAIKGSYVGGLKDGQTRLHITTAPGTLDIDGRFAAVSKRSVKLAGTVATEGFDCSKLLASTGHALEQFGLSSLNSQFDIYVANRQPEGEVSIEMPHIVYRGHTYTDLSAHAIIDGYDYSGTIEIDNADAALNLDVDASLDPAARQLSFDIDARNIDLQALNLVRNTRGRLLSLTGSGSLHGPDIDHVNGYVKLTDISFVDTDSQGPRLNRLRLDAKSDSLSAIRIESDILDGSISGQWHTASLPRLCKTIVERVFPNLTGVTDEQTVADASDNELQFKMQLKSSAPIEQLVKLPVSVLHPVDISGAVSGSRRTITFNLDAPYLLQGKKIIEGTSLRMNVDGSGDSNTGRANLYATSTIPTKNGPMTLSANAFGSDGQLDTQLSWHVSRPERYNGDISLTTRFVRSGDEARQLRTTIFVNPSLEIINDTVWKIEPSKIEIEGRRIAVDNFRVGRNGQQLSLNGVISDSDDEVMTLSLNEIDLDYVFETLGIETAMFGGRATGDFFISNAFSKTPVAYTPLLKVKNLKYNYSLMGDAEIESSWDARRKAVLIDAAIHQANGGISHIDGAIMPMADSLDLTFDADRIGIGFLKPFMSAFATDISGYASGHARLWGTFKLIDMVGDVYGEDVALTLGFTGTTYTTTDSISLRPGRIDLNDLTIKDKYGNTAKLNGWLAHTFFKAPRFNFTVNDARNLLVYDIGPRANERWYGTVYGNGRASVAGRPGYVKIDVDVSTAPKSDFTFVLTDAREASEYNFITFRDRDQHLRDSINAATAEPLLVRQMKERIASNADESAPSVYDMSIRVDVNTNALVTLVMDPVGGDKITARGDGNMRMTYDSANENLRMFGTYTLNRGNYNFTLQDIIIKDFTIEEGSKITFNGDPYAAQLDIQAAYALNANLSDLDESFLQDKELNRTNVPVHAMLLVSGDMRQPEIHYDLEFPTLSTDIYRKVRSIVNTEDMMQRQIIYLLVLNRFYTPDYMSATKGNEIVSVASSTISSQLSNILGQLSDKWSISPNFRSDRGDFSDVEVDLALSSHLLNNRLILNGNFGYRDKALNNNSFIGDFDIEYLLNRMGTIRLKAYNRYNDQNYYVKSALTTQGVGVVFKRDFDSFLSFLRPLLRRRSKAATDSTTTVPPDSVAGAD